ncbi:uncharacterized protein LOC131362405 isoform X3 [Hemibagrus wyckioides]|uniref:uncharacterized protein LOC131362405 isoform X3 n=1 Tax=Hemibagrus wyckioides TaxID=337641 RepID=UPI00266C0899|nr:uncharacterized protein LOC131362405 isoform X3 [Hemibagrus wyckioides]
MFSVNRVRFFTMEILFLLFCVQIFVGTGFTYRVPSDIPAAVLQDQDFEMETREIRLLEVVVINITCQLILSGNGYTYPVSSNIPSAVLQDLDCEQAWYRKAPGNRSELEYLSDGQLRENGTKHELLVDATRKNITISECIELHHNVTCHGSDQKFQHMYQVIKSTTSAPYDSPETPTCSITIAWIVSLILLVFVVLFLIWRFRQRVRGWWRLAHWRIFRRAENGRSNNVQLLEIKAGSNNETGLLNSFNANRDYVTVMNGCGNNGVKDAEAQPAEDEQIVTVEELPD